MTGLPPVTAQVTIGLEAWLVLAVSVLVVALLWLVGYYGVARLPEYDEDEAGYDRESAGG